jgi:hypothetical protein
MVLKVSASSYGYKMKDVLARNISNGAWDIGHGAWGMGNREEVIKVY